MKKGTYYKEIRCTKCRRLLGLEHIYRGRLSLKCKCGEINNIEYKTPVKNISKLENMENSNEKGGDK